MSIKIVIFLSLFSVWTSYAGQTTDNRSLADLSKYEAIGRIYAQILPTSKLAGVDFGDRALTRKIESNQKRGLETQFNFCSSTLASEARVITAALCAIMALNFKAQGIDVFFQASKIKQKPVLVSYAKKVGSYREEAPFKDDWALLVLEEKITDIEPLYFLRMNFSQKVPTTDLISVGYPWEVRKTIYEGFTLFESKCRYLEIRTAHPLMSPEAQKRFPGADVTDCATSQTNSGGPILYVQQTPEGPKLRIVGISVAGQFQANRIKAYFKGDFSYLAFSVPSDTILNALGIP